MSCFSRLMYLEDSINNETGFSYDILDELKENKQLDEMLKDLNIEQLFMLELEDFISIFEDKRYIYHENLRKIILHECEFMKIYSKFGYVLSLFLNNKDAYRVFPLFFKECVDHYNIPKYSNYSLEEIHSFINKYIDIATHYDINKKKYYTDVIGKAAQLYTTYSKYDDKFLNKKGTINCLDKDEFFVYSEYEAYCREYYGLSKYNISNLQDYVRWVSRYNGDGYGYDVLSYDVKNNREKLIEVKSGLSERIELTRVEYRTMYNTINKDYTDYYVYKYFYDVNTNMIYLKILKFDKLNKVLVDVNTNEVYHAIPYFDFDENRYQRVKADIVSEENYKKLLSR